MSPIVPNLETILTSPAFFGLTTASPVQRAKCRVIQGLPLGGLADDPDVVAMCGGNVADLPRTPPQEVDDISAIRVAKSLAGAAHCIHASQSVDVSDVRPGDIVRYFVAALKLDGTKPFMSHLVAGVERSPAVASLVVGEPTVTSVKLRHPSGVVIEVSPVPIDRAGASALSVFCAGAFVDEGPRMVGEEDGVKNLDHFRQGVLGRLLPGAQFLCVGSPWQPYGPIFDTFTDRYGKPGADLVVLRTRGRVANPQWWTPERIAKLEASNPIAAKTDEAAEFADGELTVFASAVVEQVFQTPSAEVAYDMCEPAIFCDPSQLRHDTWAAMVAGWMLPRTIEADSYLWVDPNDPRLPRGPVDRTPMATIQFRPSAGRPMALLIGADGQPVKDPNYHAPKSIFFVHDVMGWDPSRERGAQIAADALVKSVADMGRQYGTRNVHSDQGEAYALEAIFRQQSLRFHSWPWTAGPMKTTCVDRLRSLAVERRLYIPEHRRLRSELLRVRARATAGGFSYVVPGQGHGDFLSCLLVAMRAEIEGHVSGSPMKIDRTRHEHFRSTTL